MGGEDSGEKGELKTYMRESAKRVVCSECGEEGWRAREDEKMDRVKCKRCG